MLHVAHVTLLLTIKCEKKSKIGLTTKVYELHSNT